MARLNDIFKGAAVGLANIVAGLSGGTIAVLLNIYERLIENISNVLKHPVKVFKDVWGIGLGVFIGLIVGALVIRRAYAASPIMTSSFFCGLVIAGIPYLFSKIKNHKINWKHILIFSVTFLMIVALPYVTEGASKSINYDIGGMGISTLLGAVTAIAMIIPGVSGSMIALSIGYYDSLLGIIDDIVHGVSLGNNIVLALFVVLGIVIGLLAASKLIKYLLKNFFSYSYAGIIGLVSGSTIAIMVSAINSEYFAANSQWWQWVAGAGLFIIAAGLGYLMTQKQCREEE